MALFLFHGLGENPIPSQLVIWQQIQARLPELIRQARASIPTPETRDDPMRQFSRDEAQLKEIRIEHDGSIELFFSPTISDHEGYPLCPVATFKDWKIIESCWTP